MVVRITAIIAILSLGISAVMSRAAGPLERTVATAEPSDNPIGDDGYSVKTDRAGGPDVPCQSPHDGSDEGGIPPKQPVESWSAVIQQGMQDFSPCSARLILGPRHLLRLPGLLELEGRYAHRLHGWIEWLMALARLESTNMSVMAPPLQPHAPPYLA
jgi:hypothetical protein